MTLNQSELHGITFRDATNFDQQTSNNSITGGHTITPASFHGITWRHTINVFNPSLNHSQHILSKDKSTIHERIPQFIYDNCIFC